MVLDAPCMDCPPETLILVLAAGEAVLEAFREWDEVRTLGKSEMSCPEADGGSLVGRADVTGAFVGSWRASGVSERAKVFANVGSLRDLRD